MPLSMKKGWTRQQLLLLVISGDCSLSRACREPCGQDREKELEGKTWVTPAKVPVVGTEAQEGLQPT